MDDSYHQDCRTRVVFFKTWIVRSPAVFLQKEAKKFKTSQIAEELEELEREERFEFKIV